MESDTEPTRAEIDASQGAVLLEFGASWCPHCQAVRPVVDEQLLAHPEVAHVRVEDGPGKPLGRSFRVKLWPTLVFLKDGKVLAQAVRPEPDEVRRGMNTITAGGPL